MNSDKSATRSGLVRLYLTVLDVKTSSQALSFSVQWTKTICWGLCVPQPIGKFQESHIGGINTILILDNSAPSLKLLAFDKKSVFQQKIG